MSNKVAKELTEEEFFLQRTEQLDKAEKEGMILYPHKYEVKDNISDIRKLSESFNEDTISEEIRKSAGRVISIRGHGKLFFFTIESDGTEIQLVLKSGNEDIYKIAEFIRRGDIIGFCGKCGKTRSGEPSVFLEELKLLTPCLRVIPSQKSGFTNPEMIYRKRHIDLLVNKESKERFLIRTKIIRHLRQFLDNMGFLEVETPILNVLHGGAAAKPFKTFHNEHKMNLYMRIAPELYLKRLVIGGFNRIYEIGKQFRNEGIDLTHNPEFTSCEFYMAYGDREDIMKMTEDLLSGMAKEIKGTVKFTYEPQKRGTEEYKVDLDFSAPFKRYDILEELNKELNLNLTGENIEEKETIDKILKVMKERKIEMEKPFTLNRILDKLIGTFIEPKCINPTFVTGFPTCTSPLAKESKDRKGITERFELFIDGKEICNAYLELNIPSIMRERFKAQVADAAAGDTEAMPADEDFCQALEYGLPPTAGWGMGIDRLIMYLSNASNIRDVILFPTLKPENPSV